MKKQNIKIKTIDVNVLEWFDRINGNSYFAGNVTVNFGMPGEKRFIMPFQYGYGDHYKDMAVKKLQDENLLHAGDYRLWHLRSRGIIIRATKVENCKKRDLLGIGF